MFGGAGRVIERAVVVGVGGSDVGEVAEGNQKIDRLSFGTGMTAAIVFQTNECGTVM